MFWFLDNGVSDLTLFSLSLEFHWALIISWAFWAIISLLPHWHRQQDQRGNKFHLFVISIFILFFLLFVSKWCYFIWYRNIFLSYMEWLLFFLDRPQVISIFLIGVFKIWKIQEKPSMFTNILTYLILLQGSNIKE